MNFQYDTDDNEIEFVELDQQDFGQGTSAMNFQYNIDDNEIEFLELDHQDFGDQNMINDNKEIGIAVQQTPQEDTICIPQSTNGTLAGQETPKVAPKARRTSRFATKVYYFIRVSL